MENDLIYLKKDILFLEVKQMSKICELKKQIANGEHDGVFKRLYGLTDAIITYQRTRYTEALEAFEKLYPEISEVSIFSASGRTEVCGNHTDHNFGKTLAAGIDLDVIGVAAKSETKLEVQSKGFKPDILTVDNISYCKEEENSAKALVKGVCNGFKERGYQYGGFVAYTTSNVLKGSGVSSSAAFEVLLCTILNHFYNDGKVDAVTVAQIAQFAENKYFGKPCGLLDQTASSVGGFITMDFADPTKPVIEKIDFDFAASGHALCIVDTGGSHADLTGEYAAIPAEMKEIASFFSLPVLRGLDRERIVKNAKELRKKFGDRAVLRALHFVDENERVDAQAKALKAGDFESFLEVTKKSGRSSFMYLQNVYTSLNTAEQGLSLALCITDGFLGERGAYRVHGGGFGGTIQAFVPVDMLKEYKETINSVFGADACKVLNLRADGGIIAIA